MLVLLIQFRPRLRTSITRGYLTGTIPGDGAWNDSRPAKTTRNVVFRQDGPSQEAEIISGGTAGGTGTGRGDAKMQKLLSAGVCRPPATGKCETRKTQRHSQVGGRGNRKTRQTPEEVLAGPSCPVRSSPISYPPRASRDGQSVNQPPAPTVPPSLFESPSLYPYRAVTVHAHSAPSLSCLPSAIPLNHQSPVHQFAW